MFAMLMNPPGKKKDTTQDPRAKTHLDEKFTEETIDLILFMAGTCSEGPENSLWVNWIVLSCLTKKAESLNHES